ncbi:MAG: hypothetical protein EXQ52_08290 [Bryobacterales bacterium]|nr:hypothetical protein [Bryobacterales bacterium]
MSMRRSGFAVAAVVVLLLTAAFLALGGANSPRSEAPSGLGAIRVPAGFRVQQVAGPDLVTYPMMGTLDDRGRLFLCESSGNNITNAQMAGNPEFRIRMLVDENADGIYDRSTVFADKLTLPAGAVWYRGALYVASPPDLLRFEDTNGDGIADKRGVVVTGWNLSSNAASLHGPFFGPDGWLYLTDGRHGFNIKTMEGTTFEGKASRIWRVRPDGTGLEWFAGGGFDNPVELAFTPSGETIGTMTYFVDPRDGERDALLHFVEGGVYPKWYPVVSEFKRTGELMPVMTKFARIAPSGLARYRSKTFGAGFEGNLFSAQFNPHRIQRHILFREGATFRTEDSDFLTSSDPDFHPTDVMEDADGSLIVVDTGAWFIHGCPISRVSKPEFKGGVYRVRKEGAPRLKDPRGLDLKLTAAHFDDARFAVRDRAVETLVEASGVSPLKSLREKSASWETRAVAVWALYRIGTPEALEAVRAALRDSNFRVRTAAARAAGMARDRLAVDFLMEMTRSNEPPAKRQAAAALGQIGDARAVPALLAGSAGGVADRFVEHSIIYALIELKQDEPLKAALTHGDAGIRKTALIALDQLEALDRKQLTPFLSEPRKDLRAAALWVVAHHPDWSAEVLAFLEERLRSKEFAADERDGVKEALLAFCGDPGAQAMVAGLLNGRQRGFLLDTIERCSINKFPESWVAAIGENLDARAISILRARGVSFLDGKLEKIANDAKASRELRTSAWSALIPRKQAIDENGFEFLLGGLDPKTDANLRLSSVQALVRAKLSELQLLALAANELAKADALILPSLFDAFRNSQSEAVGAAFVAGLRKSQVSIGEPDGRRLEEVLAKYPAAVKAAAAPLLARVVAMQRERVARLEKMEPLLTAGGDAGRGRRIFFGEKVACGSCHTIGKQGGHVGPDLTAVGAIRSGHDLLEAIVFPSASFVPGHEIYRVETAEDTYAGVRGGGGIGGEVVLVTGPDSEVRIPRNKVISMKASDVSLMPEGLDESLTRAEFTDLLAFLQAQKSRETALAAVR